MFARSRFIPALLLMFLLASCSFLEEEARVAPAAETKATANTVAAVRDAAPAPPRDRPASSGERKRAQRERPVEATPNEASVGSPPRVREALPAVEEIEAEPPKPVFSVLPHPLLPPEVAEPPPPSSESLFEGDTAFTTPPPRDPAPTEPEDVEPLPLDPPFEGCPGRSLAHAVFNSFWFALDREYALFDIRLPSRSWDSVGYEFCAEVTAGLEGDALFDLLIATAETLDDGHVQIDAPDLDRFDDGWVNEYPFFDEIESVEFVVEESYLDDELEWAADDWFGWGTIGSIGYLSITSFDSLSPSGDEDDDVVAAHQAMALAMADLGGSAAIVVDVRANSGGWDAAALAVARWFAGPRTVAWSEQVRSNQAARFAFTDWRDTFVGAAVLGAYTGPVVLLTSGGTFSAAETFALAMRVREDVILLGEESSGHFSDTFEGMLPNGWFFSFSGERYRAADGEIYETQGVPIDLPVSFDPVALDRGRDLMLEEAINVVGK